MKFALTNLRQVVACASSDPASDVRTRHSVVVNDGNVLEIIPDDELRRRHPDAEIEDCEGGVLTPGFVDSHTHAVFGKWRADEFAMRSRGASYMEIARQGGGINASVRDLRARSEDELVELTRVRVREILRSGTTTVEVKSGYGLALEHELKMLRVIRRVNELEPIDLVPTFLGAHEIPEEYHNRPNEYVDIIVNEMIPAVADTRLAVFCDVFMEPGVFDLAQSTRILETGVKYGLTPKIHADEFEWSGGAELAASLDAASADHLGAISDTGIEALARSRTVATLLPVTLLMVGKKSFAPARKLIDAGATVALATDFNPGTAGSANMALTLSLACAQMHMDPHEALIGATANGTRALRLIDGRGSIVPGAPADLVLWGVADYNEIPYRIAAPLVKKVWKRGVPVFCL